MATNSKRFSNVTACTSIKSSDLVLVASKNASSNTGYYTRQCNVAVLFTNVALASVNNAVISKNSTPSNSSSNSGVVSGQFWFDDNYIYVVTSNGSVKRATLSTF